MISVVIPVYNEEACLEALFERLSSLERQGQDRYEFIFVDDGSTDGSRGIIQTLAADRENVQYILFSRNFGHVIPGIRNYPKAKGLEVGQHLHCM